jgi:hypothetical protein
MDKYSNSIHFDYECFATYNYLLTLQLSKENGESSPNHIQQLSSPTPITRAR